MALDKTERVKLEDLTPAELARIQGKRSQRQSKFKNVKIVTPNGEFDSAGEHRRYLELRSLEAGGVIRDLRRQVPFACEVNGQHICYYVADFVYLTFNGKHWGRVVEDFKGLETDVFKLKRKLMLACNSINILVTRKPTKKRPMNRRPNTPPKVRKRR